MIDPTSGRVLAPLRDDASDYRSGREGEGDGHVLTHGPGTGPKSQLSKVPDQLSRLAERWDEQSGRNSKDPSIQDAVIRLHDRNPVHVPVGMKPHGDTEVPAVEVGGQLWTLQRLDQRKGVPYYTVEDMAEWSAGLMGGMGKRKAASHRPGEADKRPRRGSETQDTGAAGSSRAGGNDAPGTEPAARTRRTPPREPRVLSDEAAGIVVRHRFPLRLDDQETTQQAGMRSTCGSHALNHLFDGTVATAGQLSLATLPQLIDRMRILGGVNVQKMLVHAEKMAPGQSYESERDRLLAALEHAGSGVAEIGRLSDASGRDNHLIVLRLVAPDQSELDAGVWLKDPLWKQPIWFVDANAALAAIEKVNESKEGTPFLQMAIPDEPLRTAQGGAGPVLEGQGLMLWHHVVEQNLQSKVAAQWGVGVDSLPLPPDTGPSTATPLPHGDAQAWIDHHTAWGVDATGATSAMASHMDMEGTTESDGASKNDSVAHPGTATERPGIGHANTWWAQDFTGGRVDVTPALRTALMSPPPGMPLVDHYARTLRDHATLCASPVNFGPEHRNSKLLKQFGDECTAETLLVTWRSAGEDGDSRSEHTLLLRREGDGFSAIDDQGASSPLTSGLTEELLARLADADGDGLRLLLPPPSDADWLVQYKGSTGKGGIPPRTARASVLNEALDTFGFPLARLQLKGGYLVGPTDEELEQLLCSLVARGKVGDSGLETDILSQVKLNRADRIELDVDLEYRSAEWRVARDSVEEQPGDVDALQALLTATEGVIQAREQLATGRRTELSDLLKRVEKKDEDGNVVEGALPLDLNEFSLVVPSHLTVPYYENISLDDDMPRRDPPKLRGGMQADQTIFTDDERETQRALRLLPTFVLKRSVPPPDSRWQDAAVRPGLSASGADVRPRSQMDRHLLSRYGAWAEENWPDADLRLARMSASNLVRGLEERVAGLSKSVLDSDDALVQVNRMLDQLGLSERNLTSLDSDCGFLTWLESHLDEEREAFHAQGLANEEIPRFVPFTELRLQENDDMNSQQKLFMERMLAKAQLLADQDPGVDRAELQRALTILKRVVLQMESQVLTEGLLTLKALPDGQVRQALRAFDLDPGTLSVADCRKELTDLLDSVEQPHPLQLTMDRFKRMPFSMQAAILGGLKNFKKVDGLHHSVNTLLGLDLQAVRLSTDYQPRLQLHRDLLEGTAEDPVGTRLSQEKRSMVNRVIYTVEEHWTPELPLTALGIALSLEGAAEFLIPLLPEAAAGARSRDRVKWQGFQKWVKGRAADLDASRPWLPENAALLDRFVDPLPPGEQDAGRVAVQHWMRSAELTMEYVASANPVVQALRSQPELSATEAETQFLQSASAAMQANPNAAPLTPAEMTSYLTRFYQEMRQS